MSRKKKIKPNNVEIHRPVAIYALCGCDRLGGPQARDRRRALKIDSRPSVHSGWCPLRRLSYPFTSRSCKVVPLRLSQLGCNVSHCWSGSCSCINSVTDGSLKKSKCHLNEGQWPLARQYHHLALIPFQKKSFKPSISVSRGGFVLESWREMWSATGEVTKSILKQKKNPNYYSCFSHSLLTRIWTFVKW